MEVTRPGTAPHPALVQRIKSRLESLGISPRAASIQALGNPYYLRDLFKGKMQAPGIDMLQRLAPVLGWTVAQLVGEQDPDYAPGALDPKTLRLVILRTDEYLRREGLTLADNDRVSLYFALHDAAGPELQAGEFTPARFAGLIRMAVSGSS